LKPATWGPGHGVSGRCDHQRAQIGGEAKRHTWYSADERPSSFTPDGKAVLFASPRLGSATETFARPHASEHSSQLYQVPLEGGRETLVLPNAALDARWDAEGRFLLYTSASIEQQFRKHQTSSAARCGSTTPKAMCTSASPAACTRAATLYGRRGARSIISARNPAR
jgi:Tol biopolymer transport system component